MAGHSKWANIKHRKAGQDAKRAKEFNKLTKEIQVAAGIGQPDPDFNPRLRAALASARKNGVPKDRIDTAVKKGSGVIEGENYEEMRYEGYSAGGVAIIVETLTDNKNRTAGNVRSIFTKAGGNLGENGSVNFMFEQAGMIEYKADIASPDEIFEEAALAGADDVESDDETHTIICSPDNFAEVRDTLEKTFGEAESSKLGWRPKDPVELDFEKAEKVIKLIENLEDDDDVQEVYGSFTIPDEIAEMLNE
ncbi:MAG: YebC/PmpR family DNA-binding transcriptional regulator [Alphaproteobacteria bacterium CG11_big_fil_rev_8_21_14_0_20_39_49]|nr:MAG: YebC/PmpR family DNA-binding transcriptional regulator [Alphaproteobacteria bacterium CG11_big_fil_rev_8_21_14_0_20_39_49]